MSMRLTKILAPDGTEIYIQYDEEETDDLQAVAVFDNVAERTEQFMRTTFGTIRGYSQIVLEAVKEGMSEFAPDKVTLEFGLQVGGEAGVPFVTKGTAQANAKISVEWDLSKKKLGELQSRMGRTVETSGKN